MVVVRVMVAAAGAVPRYLELRWSHSPVLGTAKCGLWSVYQRATAGPSRSFPKFVQRKGGPCSGHEAGARVAVTSPG